MKLPVTKRSFWLRYKWLVELISLVGVILSVGIGAWKVREQLTSASARLVQAGEAPVRTDALWYIVAGAGCAIAGAFVRFMIAKSEGHEAAERNDPKDLVAACRVMHAAIRDADTDSLRITLHRVLRGPQGPQLEQIIPYAVSPGAAKADGAGRMFSVHCGVAGLTTRSKKPLIMTRVAESAEAFREEMVAKWGYTREQAQDLDSDRWTWMAVPLMGSADHVAAVLFFDSKESGYFTDEKKRKVLDTSAEMNAYLRERYG